MILRAHNIICDDEIYIHSSFQKKSGYSDQARSQDLMCIHIEDPSSIEDPWPSPGEPPFHIQNNVQIFV